LDSSTKPTNDWQLAKNLVSSVAATFNINQNCVRVTVISYSATRTDVSIALNRYGDINSLQQGIGSLTLYGGASNLLSALQILRSQAFASNIVRSGARLVAWILTDELTCSSQITSEATTLKNNMGVSIIGLAVTQYSTVDTNCLRNVVTPNQYIEVSNYNQVSGSVSQVSQYACAATGPGPANLQHWGECCIKCLNADTDRFLEIHFFSFFSVFLSVLSYIVLFIVLICCALCLMPS